MGTVATVFPGKVSEGMKGIAPRLLYSHLKQGGFDADLAFTAESRYQANPGLSWFRKAPLRSFRVLLFSICDERQFLDVARFLDRECIPSRSSQRTEHDPLVVAGGPVVMANWEPIGDFFDLVCLGDVESLWPDLSSYLRKSPPRAEFIRDLGCTAGFVDPAMPRETRPLFSRQISFPDASFASGIGKIDRIVRAEVARGCRHACPFCQIPQVLGPYREASYDLLQRYVQEVKRHAPSCDAVELIAPSSLDHSRISDVLDLVVSEGMTPRPVSLRVDQLLHSPKALGLLGGDIKLGIEAGDEARRAQLGKPFSNGELIELCRRLADNRKVDRIILYFIVGLPDETDADIDAIVQLVHQVSGRSKQPIAVQLSVFMPESHTKLQRHAMEPIEYTRRKWARVEREVAAVAEVSAIGKVDWFYLYTLFSTGGREFAKVLEKAAAAGLSWSDPFETWAELLDTCGIPWFERLHVAHEALGLGHARSANLGAGGLPPVG